MARITRFWLIFPSDITHQAEGYPHIGTTEMEQRWREKTAITADDGDLAPF